MERLEPANILRNQQVAGSIPAGGSILIFIGLLRIPGEGEKDSGVNVKTIPG
jgi:hypothetical protein